VGKVESGWHRNRNGKYIEAESDADAAPYNQFQ